MPQIGTFTRDGSGFAGRLRSALLDMSTTLIELPQSEAENAPDFRIHLGDARGPEIGAAWKRSGEKAGEYLAIVIDDPALAQPIRANLFQSGEEAVWTLHWNRQPRRGEQA